MRSKSGIRLCIGVCARVQLARHTIFIYIKSRTKFINLLASNTEYVAFLSHRLPSLCAANDRSTADRACSRNDNLYEQERNIEHKLSARIKYFSRKKIFEKEVFVVSREQEIIHNNKQAATQWQNLGHAVESNVIAYVNETVNECTARIAGFCVIFFRCLWIVCRPIRTTAFSARSRRYKILISNSNTSKERNAVENRVHSHKYFIKTMFDAWEGGVSSLHQRCTFI